MAFKDMLISSMTVILFLGVIAWLLFIIHLLLRKAGLYRWFKFRRLSRRFRDYKFKDKIVLWCQDVLDKKWKYQDVKRFLKLTKDPYERDEYLYTYLLLKKMKGGFM